MHSESKLNHNWLAKQLINKKIASALPQMTGVVIDLGCGSRPYEKDILQYADKYLGVDWSNSLHLVQADIIVDINKSLPFKSNSIDTITCFEVLEHTYEPQVIIDEANRVLKPNGMIFISTPFQWWIHEAPWDFYRFTQYGLKYILERAGFIDIKISATSGFWSMWLLKLNYQLARLIRGPHPLRILTRTALIPCWTINQYLGRLLDSISPDERETVGYFVSARKQ